MHIFKSGSFILLLTIIILSSNQALLAQYQQKGINNVYLDYGAGAGNGKFQSYNGAINFAFGENNVLTAGYYYYKRVSPQMPTDFVPEPGDYYFLGSGPDRYPLQEFKLIGLMYGKIIYASNPKVRWVLKGGLSAGMERNNINFYKDSIASSLFTMKADRYSYTFEKKITGGLMLNAMLEFPLATFFGISIGPFANINPSSSLAGVDLRFMLGKVRDREKSNYW